MMEKFLSFISDYKKDILYIFGLSVIFIILSVISGSIFGDIYVDCSREAYIPELILKGKVIYKDFFALFLPLSYWFNAFLYLIFGKAFKVLYLYSYFNAWIILLGLYFICRVFLKEYLSSVTTLAFMCFFILSNPFSIMTYIFPYAFAMVYAVTFFTYSLLSFLYYMKTDNKKFLYGSFLLLGFVYANKPEFLLCFLPMLAVMFFKHEKIKSFLISLFLMLLPPCLCVLILFLQGFSFHDFSAYLSFLFEFFKSPEEKYFTVFFIKDMFSDKNRVLFDILYFFSVFIPSVLYVSMYFKNKYYKIFALISAPFYCLFLTYMINLNLVRGYTVNLFFWYFPVLILILCFKCRKLNTLQDKMLFFIAITGILSTSRVNFLPVHKISYSVYFIMPLLAFWLYFITGIKNRITLKAVSVVLIILAITYVPPYKRLGEIIEVLEFKSPKGNISDLYYESESFTRLVELINKTAEKDDTVLVLPEGALLNHVTGRATNPKLYQLTPNHITAIGEDNIVKELEKNPPEFIVFTDVMQSAYGHDRICETFAHKICDYTYKNYTEIADFDVALKVYKLNK